MRAVHLVVSGRVQGVGFRNAAQRQASLVGVSGWVKNVPDGSVEIHAEGTERQLDRFLAWCRVGPMAAKVEAVNVEDVAPEGFSGFSRR